jgi:transposase
VGYFAGLDVSLEETAICIVDDAGLIVREARTVSEPEALVAFFRASGMAMDRVGLEAMFADGLAASRSDRGGDCGDLH